MAAVLSLGTVGYGVAVMYALFGAPDLAMTQFAVETLTVVIFVLVFYQLARIRRSLVAARQDPRRDRGRCRRRPRHHAGVVHRRVRDDVAAGGLFRRRCSSAGATGCNVVNVILVDFRGFDTLGEITVLVTVAIGVRALLLIGEERRQ